MADRDQPTSSTRTASSARDIRAAAQAISAACGQGLEIVVEEAVPDDPDDMDDAVPAEPEADVEQDPSAADLGNRAPQPHAKGVPEPVKEMPRPTRRSLRPTGRTRRRRPTRERKRQHRGRMPGRREQNRARGVAGKARQAQEAREASQSSLGPCHGAPR